MNGAPSPGIDGILKLPPVVEKVAPSIQTVQEGASVGACGGRPVAWAWAPDPATDRASADAPVRSEPRNDG